MANIQRQEAIRQFIMKWRNKGKENQDDQSFWIDLLHDVLGVDHPTDRIEFQKTVIVDGKTKFIDAYIPETKVLIEQKSSDIPLDKQIQQSGGIFLTPYEQAKRYKDNLPSSEVPDWIITSNFREIWVYDMNQKVPAPQKFSIDNLRSQYVSLNFLVDTSIKQIDEEMELSLKAGELVGKIHDRFLEQYHDPMAKKTQNSLNALCVRLVFCLYAEDAGLFGANHDEFSKYVAQYEPKDIRQALLNIFKVLDTPVEDRDEYLSEELASFPYVNGGLFANENIVIPKITDEIKQTLEESAHFNWSKISPTIFGAVFESTLNPETRRQGGMHYTSIENIHKVIDPLFLDDLKEEFKAIQNIPVWKTKAEKLRQFQNKLASLKFFDPACGSGNFLTETFVSIRRLENQMLLELNNGQISLADESISPIKVSISQFYGIEINDFAAVVARTALWIAESQMMQETETVVRMNLNFLPLKTKANIEEGDALQMDWKRFVGNTDHLYCYGNPPFVGQSVRTKEQSDGMASIWGKGEIETKLDYVICWYKKAIDLMNQSNERIYTAFVSTNSICQGESVPTFWKKMVDSGAEIQFAHKTFKWNSEASDKAAVHCVIVGFSNYHIDKPKTLFDEGVTYTGEHINPYLYLAPDIWITNRINSPRNGLPKMTTGSPPTDDGGLTITAEEKQELLSKYPVLEKYIRPFIGAREFLHDKIGEYSRYCLWFKDGNPSDYANIPEIRIRLEKVQNLRKQSNADRIQKMADYPYLFCQIRQPDSEYLVFPRHSSESRRYIPIGFEEPYVIVGDACSIIPNIGIYQFGVLTSNVHMAWMRVVCGRIKSDFRYSPSVYNNFPWANPTDEQKALIEQTAQGILDARAKYPDSSLADLYDEFTMPAELRKAHINNDKAVMKAYGFDIKETSESDCVAKLMRMYQELTEK